MSDMTESKNEMSKGTCIISEDVIATIACSAALEVEGVSSMAQRPTNIREWVGSSASKSVKVTASNGTTVLDVYVNLFAGCRIPDVCTRVQQSVKSEVQSMTEKPVTRVNVHVVGVTIEESADSDSAEKE